MTTIMMGKQIVKDIFNMSETNNNDENREDEGEGVSSTKECSLSLTEEVDDENSFDAAQQVGK